MARAESEHGLPTRLIVALILAAALLVVVSFAGGRFSAPAAATPTSVSAEAGFARDMQTHHLQAVELSRIVREATEDGEIRLLAYDIATAQTQQVGQMQGWLNVWRLPQASAEPPMTWITQSAESGHGHSGMTSPHSAGQPMPGMATEDQLAQLRSLTGVAAEKLYLQLMIAHHEGGIEMAEAVLPRTANPTVESMARGMIKAQQSEIDYMRDLLAERG
jgi:uncharacterized protein (DUF305 family)